MIEKPWAERRDKAKATFERIRGESQAAFESFGPVRSDEDFSVLCFHAGQWVAATLLQKRRASDLDDFALRLNQGDFGHEAQANLSERNEQTLLELIAREEAAFHSTSTFRGQWPPMRRLIVYRAQLSLLRGKRCSLSEFIPLKPGAEIQREPKQRKCNTAPNNGTPAADTEESAPLTFAEALFRDQLDYGRREADRARVAFERREAEARAAEAIQAERAAGTSADLRMTIERWSKQQLAIINRCTRELETLNAGPECDSLAVMNAARERKAVTA